MCRLHTILLLYGYGFFLPFALTARQFVYTSLPRALLWAVFLLGLRPVFARNICCTQSWAIHLVWGFAPPLPIIVAVAQCHVAGIIFNRVHCVSANTCDCILASTDYSISARTGWKPKKNIAQSNALGTVDHLFCALKEQKEGESVPTVNNFVDVWVWILFSFCAYSAPVCFYIHTQGVALGCIPVGASPRPCSNINSQNYLQLRPAFARNIYCTISWTMFLLRLRPALAQM